MFKYSMMAALVSVISGCVTSDPGRQYSQSAKPRSVRSEQAAITTAKTTRSAEIKRPAIIVGTAY
jgi:Flp pilus assembly protein TadD